MFIATAVAYVCYRLKLGLLSAPGWMDAGLLSLEMVFFATSRDTLRKYYARCRQLLTARRPASR